MNVIYVLSIVYVRGGACATMNVILCIKRCFTSGGECAHERILCI